MTDEETSREADIPDELVYHAFDALDALPGREDAAEMVAGILPDDELRFILEFDCEVDTQQVISVLGTKISRQTFVLEALFSSYIESTPHFYVLRFNQPSSILSMAESFDVAYAIRSVLQLSSCEPDQSMYSADLKVSPTHQLPFNAPLDKHWSVKNIRATKAHNSAISKGSDIHIGLPGTLPGSHGELEERAIENISSDPHGLAEILIGTGRTGNAKALSMAVVAVSRQSGKIVGAAPNAKIVSIGSSASDLNHGGGMLARAIEHATCAGCQVIVLSQSGTYCRAVECAVGNAITRNVVVLATAGDTAGSVSYPARYRGVIAVGGSTIHDLPWGYSGSGQKVSFVAPAEAVWTADQYSDDDVTAQNGTALAAALAAGGAALWLAHHGVDTLNEQAIKRNCSIQDLFRRAVRHTARQPNNWDNLRHGAGIIDCEALIKLSPDKIPEAQMPLKMFPDQTGEMASLVQECVGQLPNGNEFDFTSYGAEISALAHARLNVAESKMFTPSKFIQILIGKSGDKALMQLLNQS